MSLYTRVHRSIFIYSLSLSLSLSLAHTPTPIHTPTHQHGLGVLSDAAVVTSGSLMCRQLDSTWRGKRCLLFGWSHARPDLKAFGLTFTADPANADFLLAGGPAGVTDADGA